MRKKKPQKRQKKAMHKIYLWFKKTTNQKIVMAILNMLLTLALTIEAIINAIKLLMGK